MRFRINPKYEVLRNYILEITKELEFSKSGEYIHNGRNMLKIFEFSGIKFVVKRYGKITLFNRYIYGKFRKSKAERAFLNTKRLHSLGIDSPEEIAFVDYYKNGFLKNSYYISLYSDYQSIKLITENNIEDTETKNGVEAISSFVFSMHNKGVKHNDLNAGNILFKKTEDGTYLFQLIDINRMRFYNNLSDKKRLDDLKHLSCNINVFLYLIECYAMLTSKNQYKFALEALLRRFILDKQKNSIKNVTK